MSSKAGPNLKLIVFFNYFPKQAFINLIVYSFDSLYSNSEKKLKPVFKICYLYLNFHEIS